MKGLVSYLHKQLAFSRATFGPGARTEGVLDHIREEIYEVISADTPKERKKEWVDLVILSLDGLLRQIADSNPKWSYEYVAKHAVHELVKKQNINEKRDWPNWRDQPSNKKIKAVKPT